MAADKDFPSVVELNVGGQLYTTGLSTLIQPADSLLAQMFTGKTRTPVSRDSRGRYFIDRDGQLFRYILDFLRNHKVVLPENFQERSRLRQEAEYYNLLGLIALLAGDSVTSTVKNSHDGNGIVYGQQTGRTPGFLTIGYRGTFAFGRDGLADVKFRKIQRILVCGRVSACMEVFSDQLNTSRDPDRGYEDYSARFYLKHVFLEQAFDLMAQKGYKFVSCCASGTSALVGPPESEESKWNHYNEFVFQRV